MRASDVTRIRDLTRLGQRRALCILLAFMSTQAASLLGAEIDDVVRDAFLSTHDGWSSDEVLVNDQLNESFLRACRQRLPAAEDRKFNWALLNLRKAAKLGGEVTKRKSHRHDSYRHAAEIAARLMEDRYRQNIDRVLCDPPRRVEFDTTARELAPGIAPYLLRKAALGLRKSHRLQPELVVRVADWNRVVMTTSLSEIQLDSTVIPQQPGVYLFLDNSGYLYIGEAANLRTRLTEHSRASDRMTLARYLGERSPAASPVRVEIHAFDPNSAARQVAMRRAYESELIRSRKPRFNVRP